MKNCPCRKFELVVGYTQSLVSATGARAFLRHTEDEPGPLWEVQRWRGVESSGTFSPSEVCQQPAGKTGAGVFRRRREPQVGSGEKKCSKPVMGQIFAVSRWAQFSLQRCALNVSCVVVCTVWARGSWCVWLELSWGRPGSSSWMKPQLLSTWRQMISSSLLFGLNLRTALSSLLLIDSTQSWTTQGSVYILYMTTWFKLQVYIVLQRKHRHIFLQQHNSARRSK